MSRLTWELGTARVDSFLEAPDREMTVEESLAEREAKGANHSEVKALVAGPFAIHPRHDHPDGGLILTHTGTGMRIARSYDHNALVQLLDLAERLADLDWTGEAREISTRNLDAVMAAYKEVLGS